MTKLQINKAQDAQGFRSALEDSLGDYVAMMFMPGFSTILEDKKRLRAVDLAVRGRRGERYGQDGTPPPGHRTSPQPHSAGAQD
jgi:hypothetical protein